MNEQDEMTLVTRCTCHTSDMHTEEINIPMDLPKRVGSRHRPATALDAEDTAKALVDRVNPLYTLHHTVPLDYKSSGKQSPPLALTHHN